MSRETLHTWADTREPAETDFEKGYESARDYVQLQLIRENDVVAGMQAKLDALGVAIADAGYRWTPAMRTAYERGTRRLDGDTKDAARYRWLADCQDGDLFMENPGKDALDAAIDARMRPLPSNPVVSRR
jgi:hypothetical protein